MKQNKMSLKEKEQDSKEQDSRYVYKYTVYRNMSVDDISKVFPNRGKYHYQSFNCRENENEDIDDSAGIIIVGMGIGWSIIFAIGLFAIIWNWLN